MEKMKQRLAELQAKLPDIQQKQDALWLDVKKTQNAHDAAVDVWQPAHNELEAVKDEIKYLKTFLENQ